MASNQDYTEDMAQGDFSNESYPEFQQQQEATPANENAEPNGNEAMEEATNGDGHDSNSQDPLGKDEDRKLFVGGLSWATTDKELREHFGKYGEIESITVKMDPQTGRSRGFAFLVFKTAENLDKVMNAGEHVINGKRVDPKKAKARSGKSLSVVFLKTQLKKPSDPSLELSEISLKSRCRLTE
jgi:squid-like protein